MMQAVYNKNFGDILVILNSKANDKVATNIIEHDDLIRIENGENISYNILNWSKYQIDYLNVEAVNKKVNQILEKENYDAIKLEPIHQFVVGNIEKVEKDPKSDKLNICQVNLGDSKVQIVCGGTNVRENINVVVAKVGTIMPSGLIIKKGKLLGYESNGMICSTEELNLNIARNPGEIYIVDLPIAAPFKIS